MSEQTSFVEGVVVKEYDAAQLRSLEARRLLEASGESAPWMDDYWRLIGEGWAWRQAVYIVWASLPSELRQPKTQAELATQVLGLTSDRMIREWRSSNPAIDAEVFKTRLTIVDKHLPDVLDAWAESAKDPSGRNHADRHDFLVYAGVIDDTRKFKFVPESEDDLKELSDDELKALEAGPGG